MNNERLKGSLVRYLHPTDHHPARITKGDKDFSKRLHFKDIKFSGKFTDTHKVEKKNSIRISVFGYENKVKYAIYVSKNVMMVKMLIYYR